MKALISQKNINDYNFTEELAFKYIKILGYLHSGLDVQPEHMHYLDDLKRAGLYKDDKIRVFNYKKEKKKGESIGQDIKFLISLFDNPESSLWFTPRFKYERDALKVMKDKYGLRKTAYLIFVMTYAAEGYDYIADISSPSKLINKAKSFSKQYVDQQIGQKEKKKVMDRTRLLEYKLENYGRVY